MATEIPLTQGQVALVDDEDALWLRSWSWCASQCHGKRFVAARGQRTPTGKRSVYMHREIMGLRSGDGFEVDHLNHDPLDNRRCNLVVVTPTANKRRAPSRGGSSRFVGVTFESARCRWRAQIQVDGTMLNLGRFLTEAEAVAARDSYVRHNDTGHSLNVS